jgi:hypothetical protein
LNTSPPAAWEQGARFRHKMSWAVRGPTQEPSSVGGALSPRWSVNTALPVAPTSRLPCKQPSATCDKRYRRYTAGRDAPGRDGSVRQKLAAEWAEQFVRVPESNTVPTMAREMRKHGSLGKGNAIESPVRARPQSSSGSLPSARLARRTIGVRHGLESNRR